jgi:soluble cytochrome b562
MTRSLTQHSSVGGWTETLRGLRQRFAAAAAKLDSDPRKGEESGWYVRTSEADALAESSEYLQGVNIDAALGDKFDKAIHAVLQVNETNSAAVGAERLKDVRAVYHDKQG